MVNPFLFFVRIFHGSPITITEVDFLPTVLNYTL
jgi:hypothetical protein